MSATPKLKVIEAKNGKPKMVDISPLMKGEFSIMDAKDPKGDVMRSVFYHEYVYTLYYGIPIKKNHLIAHRDNDRDNNHPHNLYEVPQEMDGYFKDHHIKKNKIFHSDVIDKRKAFIKKHFPDVFEKLELNKPLADRKYMQDIEEEKKKAAEQVMTKIKEEAEKEKVSKNDSIEPEEKVSDTKQ